MDTVPIIKSIKKFMILLMRNRQSYPEMATIITNDLRECNAFLKRIEGAGGFQGNENSRQYKGEN